MVDVKYWVSLFLDNFPVSSSVHGAVPAGACCFLKNMEREINWSGEEETLFFSFFFFAFVDNHSVATVVVGVFLFLFC